MPSCFRRGAGGDLWERGALLSSAQPGEKGTAPFPSVRQKGALLSTAQPGKRGTAEHSQGEKGTDEHSQAKRGTAEHSQGKGGTAEHSSAQGREALLSTAREEGEATRHGALSHGLASSHCLWFAPHSDCTACWASQRNWLICMTECLFGVVIFRGRSRERLH